MVLGQLHDFILNARLIHDAIDFHRLRHMQSPEKCVRVAHKTIHTHARRHVRTDAHIHTHTRTHGTRKSPSLNRFRKISPPQWLSNSYTHILICQYLIIHNLVPRLLFLHLKWRNLIILGKHVQSSLLNWLLLSWHCISYLISQLYFKYWYVLIRNRCYMHWNPWIRG